MSVCNLLHCIRFRKFIYVFTHLDYVKTNDKWCGGNINGNYNNLVDAKNACNQKTNCNAFYDIKSDNKSFVLCGSLSIMKQSDYLKSSLNTKCKMSFMNIFIASNIIHKKIIRTRLSIYYVISPF